MRAVIAGSGLLPGILVRAVDPPPMVLALEGNLPDGMTPDCVFRLETLGTVLQDLQRDGISEVCFAGGITRPVLDPTHLDAATLPLVPLFQSALQKGDDGALRAVIEIFESSGFRIRGAHEICPELTCAAGVPSQIQPTEEQKADAARGQEITGYLSAADVGQACVIYRRQAIAIEGAFGTDWMLASLRHRPDGTGGVLYKAPKAGQDLRVDMPAIGPDTVGAVQAAGLSGIVIEADRVLILDKPEVISRCDAAGLFLWSRTA